MLSMLVITFLPRSKCLFISWLQSRSAVILEPQKIKSATVSTVSPSICHQVMGPDAMILVFWMLTVWITTNCGKFLEMDIPDHLTCLLRNLFAGQETTFRTGHGIIDWFQIGKGVCQGCISSPCLFNLNAEYIMRNAGLDEAQARNKFAGRNINNFGYADAPPLWQVVYMQIHHPYGRKWRSTKEPLEESERGGWKSWLNAQCSENSDHGIWSHHFMANRWGNSGSSDRLYFGLQNNCRSWL